MSDQIINPILWVSFLAGLGGSLHCVGMCGGLVTATCERTPDLFRYQIGRLLGYLFLGASAGTLGSLLNIKSLPVYFSIVPALIIGFLFIFWGLQNYRGKKSNIPRPKLLSNLYQKMWLKLVHENKNISKAFFTGLISILLPCGLLYGVVLGTIALQHTSDALLSMLFFWLGTVPSMVLAPGFVRSILKPFKSKLPKTYAIGLMTIGVMTITFRVVKLHQLPKSEKNPVTKTHSCH